MNNIVTNDRNMGGQRHMGRMDMTCTYTADRRDTNGQGKRQIRTAGTDKYHMAGRYKRAAIEANTDGRDGQV